MYFILFVWHFLWLNPSAAASRSCCHAHVHRSLVSAIVTMTAAHVVVGLTFTHRDRGTCSNKTAFQKITNMNSSDCTFHCNLKGSIYLTRSASVSHTGLLPARCPWDWTPGGIYSSRGGVSTPLPSIWELFCQKSYIQGLESSPTEEKGKSLRALF